MGFTVPRPSSSSLCLGPCPQVSVLGTFPWTFAVQALERLCERSFSGSPLLLFPEAGVGRPLAGRSAWGQGRRPWVMESSTGCQVSLWVEGQPSLQFRERGRPIPPACLAQGLALMGNRRPPSGRALGLRPPPPPGVWGAPGHFTYRRRCCICWRRRDTFPVWVHSPASPRAHSSSHGHGSTCKGHCQPGEGDL